MNGTSWSWLSPSRDDAECRSRLDSNKSNGALAGETLGGNQGSPFQELATCVRKRVYKWPGIPPLLHTRRRPVWRWAYLVSHTCYSSPMAKVITQRTLRNES